jgi:hypothetical protein
MSNNTDALLVYVVDRSASMDHLTDATIEGFNTFIKEQANIEGKCYVSVVLFDDQIEVPFTARNITKLPKMGSENFPYFVRGWTALRDATGTAIVGAEGWLKNHPKFNGRVIVTVLTDGGENASHEWTPQALRAKVEQKKAEGWTFIIQGANDHWMQGAQMAFEKDTSFSYTPNYDGVTNAFLSNSVGVSNLRTTGNYSQSKS